MNRVMNLGLLPDQVRRDSEQMQVVKYVDHGHYESHYDSERSALGPCCIDPVARRMQTGVNALHNDLSQRCRLCRMMTVLYYLDDTEEGGAYWVVDMCMPRAYICGHLRVVCVVDARLCTYLCLYLHVGVSSALSP